MLNPRLNRQPVSSTLRFALMAMLCAIALPIAATSQASSTPAGTVTDPHGKPLGDAELRLSAINGGQMYESKTASDGSFQFSQVPAGPYMLSVRSPGFKSVRNRIDLNGGGTTIALQVQVGTLRETVTVRGGSGEGSMPRVTSASAPQASCTPSPLGGQLTPPMKVRDVRPVYKKELVDAGIEGEVLMQAKIGTDGIIRSVEVISPVNVDLEDAAIASVSQWRFTPTYLNCEPVEVQMYVTVSFKIDR